MKTYTFSVSEVMSGGQVLVFTYARQGNVARVLMQVYDAELKNPETLMSLAMPANSGGRK